ncbi:MAG TPA: FeoA family protein [Thermotogota bacterium]|nr:FeoA family protein [Thermotogota bacterium]HRW92331.1 FeoA family protein [Thermotogota bacterium]
MDGLQVPLSWLGIGDEARILDVGVPTEVQERVFGMGLYQGRVVKMVQRAPLGDPVILRVGNTTLSIRNDLAERITVELLPPFSILFAPENTPLRVVQLQGGRGFVSHMSAHGIRQGEQVMIKHKGHAHLFVRVGSRETRIGVRVALKIKVDLEKA